MQKVSFVNSCSLYKRNLAFGNVLELKTFDVVFLSNNIMNSTDKISFIRTVH